MTTRHVHEVLVEHDEIVAAPVPRSCEDQGFELPGGLYAAMAIMFAGFVTVLSLSFRSNMAVSYGAIFTFLAAFFAIPAIFPRMAREHRRTKSLDWYNFRGKGIETATGHATSAEATILVLLLPALIFGFGLAVALIAAFV